MLSICTHGENAPFPVTNDDILMHMHRTLTLKLEWGERDDLMHVCSTLTLEWGERDDLMHVCSTLTTHT